MNVGFPKLGFQGKILVSNDVIFCVIFVVHVELRFQCVSVIIFSAVNGLNARLQKPNRPTLRIGTRPKLDKKQEKNRS